MADIYLPSIIFQIRLALDELLVNAVKHGTRNNPALHVRVKASVHPDHFEAVIEDDGDGFELDAVPDPYEEANLYELAEERPGRVPGALLHGPGAWNTPTAVAGYVFSSTTGRATKPRLESPSGCC